MNRKEELDSNIDLTVKYKSLKNEVQLIHFLSSVSDEDLKFLTKKFKIFGLIYNEETDSFDCNSSFAVSDFFVSNGKFRIKFGKILGYFKCKDNKLTSLEGCPKYVKGDFNCAENQLTSLEGSPEMIDGNFFCYMNALTSLRGCSKTVRTFDCSHNQLTSLEGCPETVKVTFNCGHNQLTSLKGCPKTINSDFYCNYNELTSLEGCPKK